MKSIVVLLMALAIAFTAVPLMSTTEVEAATKSKKFSLKTSTVQIRVGKTYKVKNALKNPVVSKKVSLKGYKVSYKSSNTKVATVSSSGKITAKKKGTAKIMIYYKKKGKTTYYSKLTVKVLPKKNTPKLPKDITDSSKNEETGIYSYNPDEADDTWDKIFDDADDWDIDLK